MKTFVMLMATVCMATTVWAQSSEWRDTQFDDPALAMDPVYQLEPQYLPPATFPSQPYTPPRNDWTLGFKENRLRDLPKNRMGRSYQDQEQERLDMPTGCVGTACSD